MSIQVSGQVGPQVSGDGVGAQPFRQGKSAELIISELHGRFYEQTVRGNVFSNGMTVTSINAATFTSATTGATATPIAGVYNPSTSIINAVILQAVLGVILTALQNTGAGPFVWMYSVGNGGLSTGTVPINRATLAAAGSQCKGLAGIALTGITNALAVLGAAALGGGNSFNIATLDTAAGFSTIYQPFVENLDGSIIVPPGGILALMATTTPVAHSAASNLIWEEVTR